MKQYFPALLVLAGILFSSIPTREAWAESYAFHYSNRSKQGMTSSVCAIHTRRASIFTPGTAASEGLALLAQDGDRSTLVQELRNTKGVKRILQGSFVPSKKRSSLMRFRARPGQRLSCIFGMLVATNDGFGAVQSVRLPRTKRPTRRFRGKIYDAGSEVNTESCEHVPGGPCDAHFLGIDEHGSIQEHPGILDIADLREADLGWPRFGVRGVIEISSDE